jgi:hypothetical protein
MGLLETSTSSPSRIEHSGCEGWKLLTEASATVTPFMQRAASEKLEAILLGGV